MISFDSSEVSNWSNSPNAFHILPELARRLILATGPMPSVLDMSSGSSVRLPGWDGLLVIDQGNAWIPSGSSAWELSCEKGVRSKANKDYEKRITEPMGLEISKATFVFVTPRKWPSKRKWSDERRCRGPMG